MNNKPVCWLRAIPAIFILIFAFAAQAQPNLIPFQPPGWSDKVVVTTIPGSTNDTSPLYATNDIRVDWAVLNNGNATASTTFYVDLYTNSVLMTSFARSGLPQNFYTYVTNIDAGKFPAGANTIELVADATDVYETPPISYTKTFTVLASVLPTLSAPVSTSPANGSANQSTSPLFTWNAVSNAAYYEIIVATNASDLPTNTNATSGGPSVVINSNVTNTTYAAVNPIQPGTTYYWEVNARLFGEGGPWSSTWNYSTANPPPGLTILPDFDSSITNDPQAVAIESTIRAALGVYQSKFSDPITISITFQEMGSGLGLSSWSYYVDSYSAYRAALAAAATTADDSTALAHLPNQTDNPVNANANVNIKSTLGWVLGLNSGTPGENMGTVYLNTSSMNLSDAQSDPNKNSLFSTTCHEIDEVLGTGSALDQVYTGDFSATDPIFAEDLYRYDALGDRSYTTDTNAVSYFSLDGTTDLAQFNQSKNQFGSGDFGDWYSFFGGIVPQVQDAFSPAGSSPNLGVELRVLDVLGYHLATQVPAPQFVSETRTGNSIKLVWTTVSGSSYQLVYSTNLSLSLSLWNNLGSSITATNSTASYTDTNPPDRQRFYRVELPGGLSRSAGFERAGVVTPPTGWGTSGVWTYQP